MELGPGFIEDRHEGMGARIEGEEDRDTPGDALSQSNYGWRRHMLLALSGCDAGLEFRECDGQLAG